jgi:uncharacterized protein DUF4142
MMKALSALALAGALLMAMSPAQAADPLTDPQIAHAAYTADELDIAYAKIALLKTKNPEVRQFAELMIKDHTAANEAALALVKKLGVTPQDNPFSQTLAKNGETKKAELRGLSGAALPRLCPERVGLSRRSGQDCRRAVDTHDPECRIQEIHDRRERDFQSSPRTRKTHGGQLEVALRRRSDQ